MGQRVALNWAGLALLAGGTALQVGCGPTAAVEQPVTVTQPPANLPSLVPLPAPKTTAQSEPAALTPSTAIDDPRRLLDRTFDDIKFEMEPGDRFVRSLLTPEVEQLVGREIRIRGYMLPTMQRKGIRNFVLVRDNQECCFGPGAALYDCIVVEMMPGTSAAFSTRPMTVTGRFDVRELFGPDGNHLAIYHITASTAN